MSNKATALTSATLPLAGTEAVYVVQGGNSRQTTAAAVIASCSIIASNETITGTKTYNSSKLQLAGSTSGVTILNATATASGTLTLPAATDTLVGRATTDTLSNKAIDGGSNTITNISLTTGVTGTLPIGNGGTNASAANSARLNLTLPVYTTYANLPSLDTTKDAVAFLTDRTREGQWVWNSGDQSSRTVIQTETTTSIAGNVITLANHNLSTGAGIVTTTAVNGLSVNTVYWVINLSSSTFSLATTVENAIAGTVLTLTGTTNFTLKQLRDPLQDIYVPASGGQLDGTTGVWSSRQGENDLNIGRANFQRINDRILLGGGATRWMGDHSGTTSSSGVGSWLYDEVPSGGTQRMSYLLINAGLASVPDYVGSVSQYAVVGAARTPDGTTSQAAIGVAGYGSGHSTSGTSVVYGGYFEGRKIAGATSTSQGVEIEASNLNSTPLGTVFTPGYTYAQGSTLGIFLGSGGGNSTGAFDADIAMWITPNGAKYRTGIGFATGALTQDATTNYQHALMLPSKARVEWYDSTNGTAYAFTMHSEISDTAHQMFMIASNAGLAINNTAGNPIFNLAYTANAVNGVGFTPSVTTVAPALTAFGTDTNISINLVPKGAASVVIGTNLSLNNCVTKTTSFSLGNAENNVIINQAATTTVTLPAASSFPGRVAIFRTIQAQTLVSASSNVVPLAGGAAGTAILAATAGKWAMLASDGTNWQIMAGN